jgi:hypothetical protein
MNLQETGYEADIRDTLGSDQAGTQIIIIEAFRVFPQSLKLNVWMLP